MKKPFIARDTGKPMVVMGGYEVAEDGSLMSRPIRPSAPPIATYADRALLERYGESELEKMEYYGVLDRLRNSGLI